MGDDLRLPERNCARTPMQWSTEPHAGFTKSDKPIMPVIDQGPVRIRARERRAAAARSRTRCSTGRSASSACARKCRRSAGVTSQSSTRETRRCWRCATTGATTPCCSCTTSTRSRARSFLSRARREMRATSSINLLADDHSHADERGQPQPAARGLWISLVSGRRPRLSAEAQRHRHPAAAAHPAALTAPFAVAISGARASSQRTSRLTDYRESLSS